VNRTVTATLTTAARVLAAHWLGTPTLLSANLYLTHRCNLRCLYCSSPYRDTLELATGQWRSVIDELAALGCRRIGILGGEPLLRRDVGEVIDHVRARGMACVLTSNGLMVPRRVDDLRGLSTLVLSLDAPGPANDAQRGAGVFAAVQRALAAARAAEIPVKLNAVMSALTAPHLDALLAFCETHDLHVTVNVMRSGTPDLCHQAATIKAEDEAIHQLLDRLAAAARDNPRLLFSEVTYRYAMRWGDYGRDRFEAHELPAADPRLREGPRCQAGRFYLSIDPDGTTYPCAVTAGRITGGNVVTEGVATAWRRLHGHGCVACYAPCMVEQNFLLSLDSRVIRPFVRRHLPRFG
jgi:MoaA/NifB/PqqE/SkfB family radical SAM enzyme